jgi:hypothetical protein
MLLLSCKDSGMKLVSLSIGFSVCLAFCGCVSPRQELVLEPIGPGVPDNLNSPTHGALEVYSALENEPQFDARPYHRRYSDYRIQNSKGEELRRIHNDNDTILDGPARVELPPGSYRVIARANGYGLIAIPVLICPSQVTTIHLEGSATWRNRKLLEESNPVRLPGGEIAGWRATYVKN